MTISAATIRVFERRLNEGRSTWPAAVEDEPCEDRGQAKKDAELIIRALNLMNTYQPATR